MFLKISKNIIEAEARALLLLSKSLDTNYNKVLSWLLDLKEILYCLVLGNLVILLEKLLRH